jgi:S1-C subfamily serine protease
MLLLALFTIGASGVLAWFVADSTNDSGNTPIEAQAEPVAADSSSPAPAATPAVVQAANAGSLADEPFAVAAEIIEPSVVQLTLADGLGSGFIIDEQGTILTAAHVVGTNSQVSVRLFDGSTVEGEVVGAHVPTDVAVVKIDPAGRNLVPAALADVDDIRVGQLAVAVGSPFGFERTVTAGIISGVDRITTQGGPSMVQTDAPINPGNSGGPLINLAGEVVGINDLIFTESGTSAGVGFAISIDLAEIIADQILAGETPQLALLGVSTQPSADGSPGALVAEVVAGSAAANAGVQVGDVLVGLDGESVRGSTDLRARVIDNPPGTTIEIEVNRNGENLILSATLGSTG